MKVPAWKSFLGAKLSRWIPSLQLPTDLSPEVMSHDPGLVAAYGSDPLIGRVASARWFTETLKAHDAVAGKLRETSTPMSLWQVAGDDHVADADVSTRLFDELATSRKTLKVYPECYHEIWFEEERLRAPILRDLDQFLSELKMSQEQVQSDQEPEGED